MSLLNKKAISIKETLFYILFGLLGLLVVFIIMLSALPNLSLNGFGVRAYIAKYDTMEPTIKPYDLVFINKVNPDNLEVGDLITFYADIDYNGVDEMVTYYIYSIDDVNGVNTFRVNAEGSNIPANVLLLDDQIIGGYSFRIAGLGRLIEFVASPFGIAAIVVNVGVIVAIVLLIKDSNKKAKNQKEEEKIEA